MSYLGPATYSLLIGYSLPNLPRPGVVPLLLITVAMMMHLAAVDRVCGIK